MKEQWKQGLQWGAVAWLGWVSAHSILPAYHHIKYQQGSAGLASCLLHVAIAVGLLVALALFALGSPRARREHCLPDRRRHAARRVLPG
jgi:hypothetical protein